MLLVVFFFFFILACMPVIVYVQREEDFFGPYFPAVTSGKTGEEVFLLLLSRRDESVKSFAGNKRDRLLPHFGSGRHGKNNRCWPPKGQKRARRAKNHSKILAAPQNS